MNRGFYNLTEKERNIVLDTLDFYCVPRRIQSIKKNYSTKYDIYVNMDEEPWAFIRDKVDFALQSYRNLERNYKLPACTNKKGKTRKPRRKKSTLDKIMKKISQIPSDITTEEQLLQYCKDSGLDKTIKDELKKYLSEGTSDTKDKLIDMLDAFANAKIPMPQNKDLSEIISEGGEEISFDEVPEPIQTILLEKFDEEFLNSNKVKIFKIWNGVSFDISVVVDN